MKTYRGGANGLVAWRDGDDVKALGTFAWGNPTNPKAAELARALCLDLLGDPSRANKLHRRFMYRTVVTWPTGTEWEMSEAEFRDVIADIDKVAIETGPLVRQMDRERPVPMLDNAPPGAEWTSSPALTPNINKRGTT